MRKLLFLALLLQLLCLASAASAQDSSGDGDAAQANNPLADFKAFNLQNYYVPELSELDGQNANTFWLRYAQPCSANGSSGAHYRSQGFLRAAARRPPASVI